MIHEIRTYNLKLGQLNEYWDRFSEKLPARQELSQLGAHWYTEVGPLNQMVAVWPYESLEHVQKSDALQKPNQTRLAPRHKRSHRFNGIRNLFTSPLYGTFRRQRHRTHI